MPLEVPRYDQPVVRQAPLPTPFRPQSAPVEAFGGGRAAEGASRAAGEVVAAGGEINRQEFNAEAESAVRDYMGQLSAEEARLKGVMETMKGSEAFGATDKVLKEFDQTRDKMVKDIANPIVRDKVRGHADAFRTSLARSGELYVAQERDNYGKANTSALLKRERDNAGTGYIDPDSPTKPRRVAEAIGRQRAAVADQLHGQSPDTIAAAQASEESKTHSLVLDRMIVGGNDALAREYYKANEAGFFGEDKVEAERALAHSSYVGDATRETDRIFSPTYKPIEGAMAGTGLKVQATQGAQNMDDVRKETSKIQDTKLRSAVETMARQRLDDMKSAEHQKATESYEAAAKLVDANPDTKPEFLVPSGQWTKLPAEYRDALSRRAAKETDDSKVYLQWMDFARDHTATAALPRADFEAQYWSRMTPAHREAAAKEWQSAGEAASKAGDKLTEFKSIWTDREMVLNELKRGKIGGIAEDDTLKTIEDDGPKRKALLDYMDRADQAFLKAKVDSTTKKNPDDLEKQEIVRRMVLREKSVKIENPHWFPWFDPEKKIKDLSDEEIKKVESGYEEIPAPSIDNMKRLANGFGYKLDPENNDQDKLRLSRAYVAAILGKDALVKSILSGKD